MSKILTFKDKTSVEFSDVSTIEDCVAVVSSFKDVNDIAEKFTVDNLVGAEYDGNTIFDIVPVSVTASSENGGAITVHFINRKKTIEEINAEKIKELQNALATLAE
jgi:hypothetical protein